MTDNIPAHEGAGTRGSRIRRRGLLDLLPWLPDFNCVEIAFTRLKVLQQNTAARSADEPWEAIPPSLDALTPTRCANSFAASGFAPDQVESVLADSLWE